MARMSPELPPHTNLLNIWSHFSLGDSKRSWITCDTVFSPFCALDQHTYINRKNYPGGNFHDHLTEEKPQTPRSQMAPQKPCRTKQFRRVFSGSNHQVYHIFGWVFKKKCSSRCLIHMHMHIYIERCTYIIFIPPINLRNTKCCKMILPPQE